MADFVEISKVEDGVRLLRWFLRHFPSMPQREFYKLCRGGQIHFNIENCVVSMIKLTFIIFNIV